MNRKTGIYTHCECVQTCVLLIQPNPFAMHAKKSFRPDPVFYRSHDPFFPTLKEFAGADNQQAEKDSGVALNHFGEPAFFQPRQPVQTKAQAGSSTQSASSGPGAKEARGETQHQFAAEHTLPKDLQFGVEQLSGEDLSNVRVHRDSPEPEKLDAHAYTQGEDIHLAPGQEKHLPHEAWHVVQQKQGRVQPTLQKKNALINDNSGLEREADTMGARAAQMKPKDSTSAKKNTSRFAARNAVIQRAMKFEAQIFDNNVYKDDGKQVNILPRKYGPRDYLVRNNSGLRLESETHGQLEFETTWEKKWSKLYKQVSEMQFMANKMNNAPKEKGSNGKMYKKFPFDWAIKHLEPNKGFPTSNGLWNRNQLEEEAKVSNPDGKAEYLRSSPEKGSKVLKRIPNKEEVFVRYYSADRKWVRINFEGTWGWIRSGSLKGMKTKAYEIAATDRPLEGGEKILLGIRDQEWTAKFQISESFKLEQFESYLKQYDKKWGPKLIPDSKQFLLDQNKPNKHGTQNGPKAENGFQQMKKEWNFLHNHRKLNNFLLMVMYYIERGRNNSTRHKKVVVIDGKQTVIWEQGTAKDAFALMSRTNFASIFNSMSSKEQKLFKQMVFDMKKGILPHMGLKKSDKFFIHGSGSNEYYNFSVYSWLVGITQGEDKLSSQSAKVSAASGRFNVQEEKGKHKKLIRFENREFAGAKVPMSKWLEHTEKHYKMASELRKRPTGEDKTGLE